MDSLVVKISSHLGIKQDVCKRFDAGLTLEESITKCSRPAFGALVAKKLVGAGIIMHFLFSDSILSIDWPAPFMQADNPWGHHSNHTSNKYFETLHSTC
jgi:hypothetical protein